MNDRNLEIATNLFRTLGPLILTPLRLQLCCTSPNVPNVTSGTSPLAAATTRIFWGCDTNIGTPAIFVQSENPKDDDNVSEPSLVTVFGSKYITK